MKVTEYWINKLHREIQEKIPGSYSLIEAGYLVLGYQPRCRNDVESVPPSDVVDIVREMKDSIVEIDNEFKELHPSEIYVGAEFIKDWAERVGNTVIFKASITTAEDKPLHPRIESTYLNIIGALLECINGDNSLSGKHPHFKNESELIDFLSRQYKGYGGLSERCIRDKFKKAKESLNN